ncbi:iron-sulfur cluster insertion protein ErpA [Govanella unica]|uniref:Iron-sulfur cluster insertion protein ErpA n=1 Tax=Govanella unica TaxID=2975056 RepID=A0A9X3TXS3_9PROT|nr:iron-sulfur cluster insertion protein ErpA [Govania unica]MDA5193312.1 iron-sulfur cluster insertion protein ErpA [Govania unica]
MTSHPLSVTQNAAKRVLQLIEKQKNPALKLRLAVSGGGCSGFQYGFSFDETVQDDDLVIEDHGITVLVDSISLPFLEGVEIDFVQDLSGSTFQVRNPNATASCGCGTSFAV